MSPFLAAIYLPVLLASAAVAPTPAPATATPEAASPLAAVDVAVVTDPNDVRALAVDPGSGDIWTATGGGIVRWAAGGVSPTVVAAIASDVVAADDIAVGPSGEVWAIDDARAAHRSADGAWTLIVPPPLPTPYDGGLAPRSPLRSVAVDAAGGVWLGRDTAVTRRGADGRWSTLHGFVGSVDRIAPAAGGDVWFVTPSDPTAVLHRRGPDGARTRHAPHRDGLRIASPADLALTPDGTAWLADAIGPPIAVDVLPSGADRWQAAPLGDLDTVAASAGRLGRLVGLALDRRGAPSIAVEAGLFHHDRSSARWVFDGVDGGPAPLVALAEIRALAIGPDGAAWLGGRGGLAAVRGPGAATLHRAAGLPDNHVTAVAVAADGIWFGTRDGADHLAPDGRLTHLAAAPGSLPDRHVHAIAVAADGAVWFATSGGLARRTPDGAWTTFGPADGLADAVVHDVAVAADGAVWCATGTVRSPTERPARIGVSRRGPDGAWAHYGFDDGLPALTPTVVLPRADGSVWVGFDPAITYRGQAYGARNLARFDPAAGWSRIEAPDAVVRDAAVYDLAETTDGALWVLGSRGLARRAADGTWLTSAEQPRWHLGATAEAGALAVDGGGTLWVGSRWQPLHARMADGTWRIAPPQLALEGVTDLALGRDGRVWAATLARGARGFRAADAPPALPPPLVVAPQ